MEPGGRARCAAAVIEKAARTLRRAKAGAWLVVLPRTRVRFGSCAPTTGCVEGGAGQRAVCGVLGVRRSPGTLSRGFVFV
eukprot:5451077-Prymnesium_polylepis.1